MVEEGWGAQVEEALVRKGWDCMEPVLATINVVNGVCFMARGVLTHVVKFKASELWSGAEQGVEVDLKFGDLSSVKWTTEGDVRKLTALLQDKDVTVTLKKDEAEIQESEKDKYGIGDFVLRFTVLPASVDKSLLYAGILPYSKAALEAVEKTLEVTDIHTVALQLFENRGKWTNGHPIRYYKLDNQQDMEPDQELNGKMELVKKQEQDLEYVTRSGEIGGTTTINNGPVNIGEMTAAEANIATDRGNIGNIDANEANINTEGDTAIGVVGDNITQQGDINFGSAEDSSGTSTDGQRPEEGEPCYITLPSQDLLIPGQAKPIRVQIQVQAPSQESFVDLESQRIKSPCRYSVQISVVCLTFLLLFFLVGLYELTIIFPTIFTYMYLVFSQIILVLKGSMPVASPAVGTTTFSSTTASPITTNMNLATIISTTTATVTGIVTASTSTPQTTNITTFTTTTNGIETTTICYTSVLNTTAANNASTTTVTETNNTNKKNKVATTTTTTSTAQTTSTTETTSTRTTIATTTTTNHITPAATSTQIPTTTTATSTTSIASTTTQSEITTNIITTTCYTVLDNTSTTISESSITTITPIETSSNTTQALTSTIPS